MMVLSCGDVGNNKHNVTLNALAHIPNFNDPEKAEIIKHCEKPRKILEKSKTHS